MSHPLSTPCKAPKASVRREDILLSDRDLAEFREIFNLVDTDGSGVIDAAELGQLVESVGMRMSKDELQKMVEDLDKDGSGEIDFDEFVSTMSKGVNPKHSATEVRTAFQTFSRNAPPGLIRMSDLYEALTVYIRAEVDHREISRLLQQFDDSVIYLPQVIDDDGLPVPFFNYSDYISLMISS
eukprot:GEMP01075132.1.p1 GENE.GEMP01075132.1~~GEMP01075132.1.p1  ORF type:complete len:183 (-),score=55.08 GEMP01075132.1:475-1023(-)